MFQMPKCKDRSAHVPKILAIMTKFNISKMTMVCLLPKRKLVANLFIYLFNLRPLKKSLLACKKYSIANPQSMEGVLRFRVHKSLMVLSLAMKTHGHVIFSLTLELSVK